jgi:hypothetical protein
MTARQVKSSALDAALPSQGEPELDRVLPPESQARRRPSLREELREHLGLILLMALLAFLVGCLILHPHGNAHHMRHTVEVWAMRWPWDAAP